MQRVLAACNALDLSMPGSDLADLAATQSVPIWASVAQYFQLLSETNAHTNLIRFASVEDFIERHLIDTLSILPYLPQETYMADIGSGSGVPGLLASLLRPDIRVTLFESIGKKARFLEQCIETLQLSPRVKVVCERCEVVGRSKKFRGKFDRLTARAVAAMPTLLELSIPLLKPGGKLIAMKGTGIADEVRQAERAFELLYAIVERCDTPADTALAQSRIVIIEKRRETPLKYPRNVGIPKKSPL